MSNFKDDSMVKIKSKAYYKMLVHVLRFGSKTRPRHQFKEVMGMLIGYLEGNGKIKDVIIEDAIPISHGGSIEVTFAPNDYVSFSLVDEKFAKKNWFTVGWYHSHPSLDIFFSSTDIRNQLGWQSQNPSAIGIVFDHNYLERTGDLGFRTFRLDDPNRGDLSNYHEVNTIVEIPKSLKFYDDIVNLISSIHTKDPPILEINEKPEIFNDVSIPGDDQLIGEISELDSTKIINTITNGISGMIEAILHPTIMMYNKWSQNLGREINNNNLSVKETLLDLKNILSNQIEEIQTYLKNSLESTLNNLDYYVDDKFDILGKKVNDTLNSINELEDNIKNQVKNTFIELNTGLEEKLNSLSKIGTENINKIDNTNREILDILHQKKEMIENLKKSNDINQDRIKNEFNDYYKKVENEYEKDYKKYQNAITEFTKKLEKITSNISDLKLNNEKSLQSLKNKINNLNNDNQNLKKDHDDMNSKIKNYEKQLEELKNENYRLKRQLEEQKRGE